MAAQHGKWLEIVGWILGAAIYLFGVTQHCKKHPGVK